MSHFDGLIEEISRGYPTFLRGSDLIDLGLYATPQALSISMKEGKAPPAIRVSSHKIVFPRASLISWLLEKAIETNKNEEITDEAYA